jgi:hypothetical protein
MRQTSQNFGMTLQSARQFEEQARLTRNTATGEYSVEKLMSPAAL